MRLVTECLAFGCLGERELAKTSSSYEEASARAGVSSGLDSYETVVLTADSCLMLLATGDAKHRQ